MSRIFAMMHLNQTLAKLANDGLDAKTKEIDALARQKENLSILIDKLTKMKGGGPTEQEVKDLKSWAAENTKGTGVNLGDPNDANHLADKQIDYWDAGGRKAAWMATPDKKEDKKNLDQWGDVITLVQHAMDRISDEIAKQKIGADRLMHEATDGEARVSGLLNDYKGLLQEMRK